MQTFTVQRTRWLRGKGTDCSALQRGNGYKCCLGFCLQQLGVDGILNSPEPEDTGMEIPIFTMADIFNDGTIINTALSDRAMDINDDPNIDDHTREEKIKRLFEKHGLTITFVG